MTPVENSQWNERFRTPLADALWALRMTADAAEVWTENGRLVAQFTNQATAEGVIEDHNIGVEMDRPDPPEVVQSLAEKKAARMADMRKNDPPGSRLLELIIQATSRVMNLVSLNAPRFCITNDLNLIGERIDMLKTMYPPLEEVDD